MPAERVSMRKIRDVLRLTHALGMSRRLVGEATGIGKTAVGEYVRRAAVAGLSWPIPDEIDDAELERRLFPPPDTASSTSRTEPDWSHNHAELKRRGVTLALRAVQRLEEAHLADDAILEFMNMRRAAAPRRWRAAFVHTKSIVQFART